jgi:hypothetical protein
MNKNTIIAALISIVITVVMLGCGRDNTGGPYRLITNTFTASPTITQTPTITMTPALFIYYSGGGMVKTEYLITLIWTPINATGFGVALRYNDAQGKPISDAGVDVDGNTLTEQDDSGNYLTYTLSHAYNPGDIINMTIITGIGSTFASAVMPERAVFSWPDSGDTLDSSVDNTIHWTYPGAQPDEVSFTVLKAVFDPPEIYLDVVLPGSTAQYTIPAGTLPAGQEDIYLLISGVDNSSYSGVEPWSNSFTVRNGQAVSIKTE